MVRAALLLSAVLALCVSLSSAQQYEFCYTLQGGASTTTGGYAVWSHGYFYTSGSGSTVTITNTAITRNVINAVGQRHTEQLSGIVPVNDRVDQSLYLTYTSGNGYVDGSGIQLPINGTLNPNTGLGTLLGYDSTSQPATIVSAYGQTSQLNANINLLYTGTNYGERLDAGGQTIAVSSSYFQLQAYNPSTPITNCSITVYQPLCVNYPATPPAGSVLFNITLTTPWAQLPSAYIGDLFAALTVTLLPGNTQAPYLGFFMFSCYPLFSTISTAQPQLWFYLNANSVQAVGLSMSTVVSTIYSALQPSSTAINNAYLPTAEQGLIGSAGCPQVYNGANYPGITGCGGTTTGGGTTTASPTYEFCYTLQGGASPTTGGYAVWSHGYFYTSGSGSPVTITNTAITRNVINAVGQRHTEQLSGIVPVNDRVDQSLYLTPTSGDGYVDGSGIQLPINGTLNPNTGLGTLLGYDSTSQPATIVSAYGQTSQLNANINLLYTGTNYGERLDAGGQTIAVSSSYFQLQAYNPSTPITNCSITVYQPLCVNYPATPPAGSVLFNITLTTPWAQLPSAYIGDLFAALTVALLPSNTQAPYLGFFLFSCYPLFSTVTTAQPQLWFYLNANSAQSMGLSVSSIVPTVYSALQPSSTAINNAYLPTAEQGLIGAVGCPQVYNGGNFAGVSGCGTPSASVSSSSSSTASSVVPPPSQPSPSSSSSSIAAPTNVGGGGTNTNTNTSSGSSGLSHGAIAGIVIGSVVGALLLLFILIALMRCASSSGSGKSTTTTTTTSTNGADHKRFENEASQVSTANTDGVEMA